MFFVYVLLSEKDNKRYIGQTENFERRMEEHKNGQVKSTKHRRPLRLIYFEKFETKQESMLREKYFKTGSGRRYLSSINR